MRLFPDTPIKYRKQTHTIESSEATRAATPEVIMIALARLVPVPFGGPVMMDKRVDCK